MIRTSEETGGWKISQVIGGESGPEVTEDDHISAMAFDLKGKHLAVGDSFGRVIIFEKENQTETGLEYGFLTEMRAHIESFDVLRSETDTPRIVDIKWLRSMGSSLVFLTATEKSINLCKAGQKHKKVYKPLNVQAEGVEELLVPRPRVDEKLTWQHTISRTYPKLHNNLINSISVCANEINFLSSDELSIFMWHVEKELKAFPLIEFKNAMTEEVTEVITSSQYNPKQESIFLFSTNKGARLCDNRKSLSSSRQTVRFEELSSPVKKNIFTDSLAFVSSAAFCGDSKIVTREFFQTKVWDVRMPSRALSTTLINEGLKTKLAEMYQNEALLERFNVVSSPCGKRHATGMFNKTFHILDNEGDNNQQVTLDFKGSLKMKKMVRGTAEALPEPYNFSHRSPRIAWNPTEDIIAVPLDSSIFIYSSL
jgi:serine/threonine-protein phosphatase 2A regulatory subunit B